MQTKGHHHRESNKLICRFTVAQYTFAQDIKFLFNIIYIDIHARSAFEHNS